MALSDDALTTVERLAGFMEIDTPDSASVLEISMQVTINAVTKFIQRYTQIIFIETTYTQEEYSTERTQDFNLNHFPVSSSETFLLERRNSTLGEDDWETINSNYYTVDFKAGIVESMGGMYFGRTQYGYRVTYTAGYSFDNITIFLSDTDAADIEVACWLISQDIQKNRGRNSSIKSEKVGDYAVSYGSISKIMFGNPQAKAVLDSYKDIGQELSVLTPRQTI